MTEDEAGKIFMWQCVGHNPTRWQLGWYCPMDQKVYFPEAEITRRSDGRWAIAVHLHGQPDFFGIEPNRDEAILQVGNIIFGIRNDNEPTTTTG